MVKKKAASRTRLRNMAETAQKKRFWSKHLHDGVLRRRGDAYVF